MEKSPYQRRKRILSRDDARAILSEHVRPLIHSLDQSWEWVQAIFDEDPERRVTFDASLEATMVNMRFVHLSQQHFLEHPKAAVHMHGRHMAVTLDGELRLRFKKLDHKLRSGNVRTNRQRTIYHQLEIEGIEEPTDVTFGYVTSPAGDSISGVYATCPIGWCNNAWMLVVRDPGLEDGYQLFGGGDDSPKDSEFIVVPKTGAAKGRDATA